MNGEGAVETKRALIQCVFLLFDYSLIQSI